jgi:hypothetical protein
MQETMTMPLKLNVGVSRKIGLPDYGSAGASMNLELELEAGLLETDLDAFHKRVRTAYLEAQRAVVEEIARLQDQDAGVPADAHSATNGHSHRNGHGGHETVKGRPLSSAKSRPARPATPGQVKAIYAIARAQGADLEGLLHDDYGVARPEELSLAQASQLIDQLKATAA